MALVATGVLAPAAQASAATATLTSVPNSFVTTGNYGLTTTNISLANAGDLLVIWVKARFLTPYTPIKIANFSSSGTGAIGTPVMAIQHYTMQHPNNDDEIWYAPITTAGSITVNFTWSAPSSYYLEYSTQEFQPSTPSIFSTDTMSYLETTVASSTVQFPSLPPAGAGELYAGYDSNSMGTTYTSPMPTGYTVSPTADYDAIIVNPDVSSSPQQPSATGATASSQSSIAALVVATTAPQSTVTYNGNSSDGGGMNPESSSVPWTLNVNTFTRSGYTFAGWNTLATGLGTSYAAGVTYNFSSSITLYAQWTADYYNVTFNGNLSTGGSMGVETHNAPTALTSNAFTRSGYAFTGWNTLANGLGTGYADGASFNFLSNLTLYAQWSPGVTFDGNGSTGGSMSAESGKGPTALTLNAFTRTG